jgi:muramidase (phage lysozyme)
MVEDLRLFANSLTRNPQQFVTQHFLKQRRFEANNLKKHVIANCSTAALRYQTLNTSHHPELVEGHLTLFGVSEKPTILIFPTH